MLSMYVECLESLNKDKPKSAKQKVTNQGYSGLKLYYYFFPKEHLGFHYG